ncbi:MAG: glycosyltransferase [bacterium]|nr:glycosyltransferase [bacterium]
MIWLASFPRSGNTFLRIILHEVYGLPSSTFHNEPDYAVDPDYTSYPIVKTHLLPHQLVPDDPGIPAVYLVRDGRDALVSIAHHRKDIVAPGSNFEVNLQEAILAERGSFFGGWSQNVLQWEKRASIVIRFEDVIRNPLTCVERLRTVIDLPEPQRDKLPTFEELQHKDMPYGSGVKRKLPVEERERRRQKFFRRGQIDTWKDEMPYELHELFWKLHGHAMEQFGYEKGVHIKLPEKDAGFYAKHKCKQLVTMINPWKGANMRKKRVLIEASDIMLGSNDGCQRYILELLQGLLPAIKQKDCGWEIDVHLGMRSIFPLLEIEELIVALGRESNTKSDPSAQQLQQFSTFSAMLRLKSFVFNTMKTVFPDTIVSVLQEWNRTVQGLIWKHFKSVNFERYDLIHLTLPQFYNTIADSHTKLVTTVHDLSHRHFPQFHVKNNIVCAEKGMDFSISRNSAFIAVSEATRQDILSEYQDVKNHQVHTVYEGYNPRTFYPVHDPQQFKEMREKYHIPDTSYLLSLSTLEPRKNLLNMIRAFLLLLEEHPELDMILVIAGQKGWKYKELFKDQELHSDRVFFPGFIAEEDLAALYSGALALCYVSYYEGFGLPLLEAMSCGTPVIYGNNSSMPEIADKAGLPADPDNIANIKDQFERIVLDEALRKKLAEQACHQAQKFSWEKTAHETLTVYDQLIKHSS